MPILTQISPPAAAVVVAVVVVVVGIAVAVLVGMADQSLLGSTMFGLKAFPGLFSCLPVQSWKYSSLPEWRPLIGPDPTR